MVDRVDGEGRVRLPGLSSRAYEHPADRSALVALRKVPGFAQILKAFAGMVGDRALRLQFLASGVKVGERQFAGVHGLFTESVEILGLAETPELYVAQAPVPQAACLGMETPFVVVTTGLLDLVEDEELRWVLGHELGHALSGHAVYRSMLYYLSSMAINAAGLAGLPVLAVVTALREWYRKAELSADRAGLLAGQDPDAAVRALMKLAGGARLDQMDPEAFLAQAAEYEAAGDVRDGLLKLMNQQAITHPYPVARAGSLTAWVADGHYARILGGEYPRTEEDPLVSPLDEVKAAAKEYKTTIEKSTDPLWKFVRGAADDVGKAGGTVLDKLRRPPGQ
jgi:hypothetical protein